MKKKYNQRIARLAIALLNAWTGKYLVPPKDRKMKFGMELFSTDSYGIKLHSPKESTECGTTCCFAGYAPFAMPYTRRLRDWESVMEYLTGSSRYSQRTNSFLFNSNWESIPKNAAIRALYLLENGEAPDSTYSYTMNRKWAKSYMKLSKKTLIERLEKFL